MRLKTNSSPVKAVAYQLLLVGLLAAGLPSENYAAGSSGEGPRTATQQTDPQLPQQPTDISPLLIGETIPDQNLATADGKLVSLRQQLAQKPTILIFYRGGWCPFCSKQLAGLALIEEDLRKLGYQLIAISTDSPGNLAKTLTKQQLNYLLLSDSELTLAKQVGIAYQAPKNYEQIVEEGSGGKNVDKLLPVPSVFMINTQGVIQFEYINPDFKQRMSPDLLLSAAAALAKEPKSKG